MLLRPQQVDVSTKAGSSGELSTVAPARCIACVTKTCHIRPGSPGLVCWAIKYCALACQISCQGAVATAAALCRSHQAVRHHQGGVFALQPESVFLAGRFLSLGELTQHTVCCQESKLFLPAPCAPSAAYYPPLAFSFTGCLWHVQLPAIWPSIMLPAAAQHTPP